MIGIDLNELQFLVFSKPSRHHVGHFLGLELLSSLLNCVALYELLEIAFEPLAEFVRIVLFGPLECCSQDSHGYSRCSTPIFFCDAEKQLMGFAAKGHLKRRKGFALS